MDNTSKKSNIVQMDIIEKIGQHFYEKLNDNYFGLYFVDLDSGYAKIVKTGHPEITGEAGLIVEYTSLMKKIASASRDDAAEFINRISDVDFLKKGFTEEESGYYEYKSHIFNGEKWVNVTGIVVTRNEKGEASGLALGFSLLDEDASKRHEAELQLKQSMKVLGGLADEYVALYHLELSTGLYKNYYATERIADTASNFDRFPLLINLYNNFIESDAVHPDYKQQLHDFYPSDEGIKQALKDRKKITTLFLRDYGEGYLWTELTAIKCEGDDEETKNIIFGVAEVDKEVKERTERFKEADEASKLINGIVSNYNVAFTVNMVNEDFNLLKLERIVSNKIDTFHNYSEAISGLINILHDNDKERVMHELDFDHIRERFKSTHSYTIEYRTNINGVTKWQEMIITSIDKDEVAMGFTEKDLEITKRRLEEKRYDEYLALFVIDMDTGMIKPLKVSSLFDTVGVGESVPYEYGMKKFAASYEGEAKDFFSDISEISRLKQSFVSEDKRTFSYKSTKLGNDKWIDVVSYVILRNDDGSPSMVTLGFSVVDALASARKELLDQLNQNMHMIGGLASGYNALYYINIDENLLHIYTLDETKYPGSREIFEGEEKDFYKIIGGYGLSEQVHPDDRHLFKDFGTEWIREKLTDRKKYSMRFRAATDSGYRWDEMELIKYEEKSEMANAVAVGFTDRDADIRNEQAINNSFEVLGRELPPDESINQILSIAGDFYEADRCYVFEYVRDAGIINNTYEWCAGGIEPMIDKLQKLPIDVVEGWNNEFKRQGAFHMDALDSEHNTEETVAILEMQGIESLVAAPLMNGDEIVGFIGVDNPTKAKKDINILEKASAVIYSEILKRKENDEEHVTLGKLTDTFLSVYYTDLSTDYMRTWKMDEEYVESYGSVQNYSVSMGGYVRENIAERDRERCIEMTSPEYVLEQFKTHDRFSIDMTDIMLGYERNVVADYIKVNEDGTQLVICFRDVTDTLAKEKEQQKLLEEARVAAESANKSKTSFLFNMSHDIRTPMNAITGFTAMAKKHLDDKEKVEDYLEKIEMSGQQLLTLVNQVLEMARIESGKIELEENPINVHDEYGAAVTVLSEQAKANGLVFHHSLSDVIHNNIFADRARMNSITLNITGNAMKYTPKGGTVEYNLKEIPGRKEGYATFVFSVADTGIGMSEEYQKVLFDPFTREKTSTVSRIQGTGLGMSIVKELVDLLGGDIKVQSELGKGTRFDITVDFKIDDHANKAKETETDKTVSLTGFRILLVEDNELNREIAMEILDEAGLIVEDADDGTSAVEILKEKGPDYYDFILMDIQMPVMNGYETTKMIRKMYPDKHIPIIALSANAFAEDKAASIAAGMDDHVAKPINAKELFSTLARFL